MASFTGVSSGRGHEKHLAACRIGEHLDDLLGLGAQRAAPGRVGEPARAREEGHSVARSPGRRAR